LAEDMLLQNMISPYAVTKKTGEDFCYYFHQQYGIDIMALRFFTVYGPGQRPDLAIHKFVKMIAEGKELTLYGDGSSLRDYTYIDDIIDGVTSAVDYVKTNTSVFEIVNLSGKNMIGLIDMVKQLESALGQKAKLVY